MSNLTPLTAMRCICCGKSANDVDRMMQINDDAYICNSCTSDINALFARSGIDEEIEFQQETNKLYPSKIKEFLDEYVIGQDSAKKALAVEVYNHYKRINNQNDDIEKSNILLIGDSGTGKTLLAKTLAKMLDVPFAICDCNALTQAGYVGEDVESILEQLVSMADGDIDKAQRGIVLLDEVDKIAKRNISSSTEKDAAGEGVQAALLKILEEHTVTVKIENGRKERTAEINTKNILFICAGAFFGLDKILEKNHSAIGPGIGFSASIEKADSNVINNVTEQDIIDYGFLPEFVGRLPVIVKMHRLTKDDYRRILTEPKNSITKQYQTLLGLDNIELEFSEKFLDDVVETAFNTKRGARALRSAIANRMTEIIFEINDESYGKKITI